MSGFFDQLIVEVEFASGTWTDVTSYVELGQQPLEFKRGRGNAFEAVSTGMLSMLLDNPDGRFTPSSALLSTGAANPYYPNVVENKRVRVRATHLGNFVVNPSFETTTAPWTGTAFGYDTTAIAVDATYAQSGTKCLKVTYPASVNGTASALIAVGGLTVGATYTLSVYARANTGQPDWCVIVYSNATGATVSTKDAMVRSSVTFVATATDHFVGVANASAYSAGKLLYVDAVQVEFGSTARTYTEAGPQYDLWLGYVDAWTSTFPGGEASWSQVAVTASDRFKLLDRRQLSTVYEETARYAGADAFYPLANTNEDSVGLEVTDRIRPDGAGTIVQPAFNTAALQTWDNTNKPLQLSGALSFAGAVNSSNGYGAGVALIPALSLGTGDYTFTIGFWFNTTVGGTSVMFNGSYNALIYSTGTTIFVYHQSAYLDCATDVNDGRWHFIVAVLTKSAGTYSADAWIDNSYKGTISSAAGTVGPLTTWTINGQTNFAGLIYSPSKETSSFDVSYAGLFMADSDLSAYVTDLYNAGHNNITGDTAGARTARILGWSGLLASEYAIDADTDAVIGGQDVAGKSALVALQEIAQAEYAPVIMGGDGDVVQQSRARRATFVPESTFDANLDLDGASLVLDLADEGIANIVVGQVTGGANVSVFVSDTFVDSYIDSFSNAVLSPVQDTVEAPWSDLGQARDAAYRRLQERYQARLRMSPVVITPLTSSTDIWVACFTLGISDMFRVTGLKASSGGGSTQRDFFAESTTWSIGKDDIRLVVDTTALDRAFGQVEFDDTTTGRFTHDAGVMSVATVGALSGTGTGTFTIATSSGPLWTVIAGDYPLTVKIDEEEITLSGMSGGASPQTATISARGVNGTTAGAHAAGSLIELWPVPSFAH